MNAREEFALHTVDAAEQSAVAPAVAVAAGAPAVAEADLPAIVQGLRQARQQWRTAVQANQLLASELPSRQVLAQVIDDLHGVLFPLRLGHIDPAIGDEDYYVGHTLGQTLKTLRQQVELELRHPSHVWPFGQTADVATQAARIVRDFGAGLPKVRSLLDQDIVAAYDGDPAARSLDEILLCYPGIQAMNHHRLAHRLYQLGVPTLARIVAERAHGLTGIDIHPGAQIGAGFFIDHGTGVVIGETAVIGRHVRLYQTVTLGAKRFSSDEQGRLLKGGARHPVIEDDVVIYAGATVLGRVTVGHGSIIGGNVWLTHSVPPESRIAQAQSRQADPEEYHIDGSGI